MVTTSAANGVRQPVEAGLEQKLLKIFGATEATRAVGDVKNTAAKEKRAKSALQAGRDDD